MEISNIKKACAHPHTNTNTQNRLQGTLSLHSELKGLNCEKWCSIGIKDMNSGEPDSLDLNAVSTCGQVFNCYLLEFHYNKIHKPHLTGLLMIKFKVLEQCLTHGKHHVCV